MAIYQPGDTVRLATSFMVGVTLTDPTTVSLTVVDPAGTSTTYTYALAQVVKDSTGVYHKDVAATTAGIWSWKWTGTGAAAGVDEGTFTVESSLLGAGLLCSVDDVRAFLQKPGTDTAQDDVITVMIARASSHIMRYCRREFAPVGAAGVSRVFQLNGGYEIDMSPYDLRAVTAVTLDPNLTVPEQTALTAATDWLLLPVNSPDGVYQRIALSRIAPCGTQSTRINFGFRQVQVTGTWGFASVPEDVAQACIATVGIWMRRDIQAFTATFNITEDRLERPEAIPSAARAMLSSWRRWEPVR